VVSKNNLAGQILYKNPPKNGVFANYAKKAEEKSDFRGRSTLLQNFKNMICGTGERLN